MKKLWTRLKAHWHHAMIPLAGVLQIVESQWSLVNLYFGKWAGAILVGIGVVKYGLNFYAAKKSVESEKPNADSPVD